MSELKNKILQQIAKNGGRLNTRDLLIMENPKAFSKDEVNKAITNYNQRNKYYEYNNLKFWTEDEIQAIIDTIDKPLSYASSLLPDRTVMSVSWQRGRYRKLLTQTTSVQNS